MIKFKEIILNDNRIVVSCTTDEQARNLLAWAHSKGKTWCNGETYLSNTCWDIHQEFTCYNLCFGEYSSRMAYSTERPKCILTYQEVIRW